MAVELFANSASTTVAAAQTAVAAGTVQTWTVASSTGFPAASNTAVPPTEFRVQDPAQPGEIMLVTNVSGTTWTVTRAVEGTSAAHAAGFTVRPVFSAGSVAAIGRADREFDIKKDFGAKGDGVTNDGPALQAAFNAVPTTGAVINFPPGNYISNQPLTLPQNRRLLLRGTHSPVYYGGSQSMESQCKISAGPAFSGTNDTGLINCNVAGGGDVKGISWERMCLSGNGQAASGGGYIHGIRFIDNSRYNGEMSWAFTSVTIGGFTGSGTYGQLHVAQWQNCYIQNCNRWGTEVINNDRWNDVKAVNTYWFFNRLGGALFAGGVTTAGSRAPSGFCQFTNCRFERGGQVFGFPTNSPTQANWVADAPGVRLQRAANFSFTSCTTDANTGVGFDVLGETGGWASAMLNNVTFTTCFANRDGGGAQTTLPATDVSSGYRVRGVSTAGTDEPADIHFVGCDSATGGSSDTGGSTVISPAFGMSAVNAQLLDWLLGRPAGVTSNMNIGAIDTVWASSFLWNDAGRLVTRNRLAITTEIGVGMTEIGMWQDLGTAAVAARGLDWPSALTELDGTTSRGSRRMFDPVDMGVQFQVSVNIKPTVAPTAATTLVVSIRDAATTGNLLCTTNVSVPANSTATVTALGAWTTRPSWFSSARELAVFISGGNGTADYVLRNVALHWKGGGA